jgi:hypothetical protein
MHKIWISNIPCTTLGKMMHRDYSLASNTYTRTQRRIYTYRLVTFKVNNFYLMHFCRALKYSSSFSSIHTVLKVIPKTRLYPNSVLRLLQLNSKMFSYYYFCEVKITLI